MSIALFFKGFMIGIAIAAPVGPIGVLCIQRTLARGVFHGLVSGLGAATADALYGCIAAFGLTVVSDLLLAHQSWFRLIGGVFLGYLGIKAILAQPVLQNATERPLVPLHAYGTTFFLTLTNPMTILAFAAIFSGVGLIDQSLRYSSASLMVLGVFLGSGLWWGFLSSFTNLFREKCTPPTLVWINRISGMIIFIFGVLACLTPFQ
jgi:threonine/homoserine/homoserine lactone efflux protein